MPRHLISNLLGLVGAVIGGVLGFYTFGWLISQRFYGLMIPGALLGLGCGLLARHPSVLRGILCGVSAVALALFAEWKYFPFKDDESFRYFLSNVTSLRPVTMLMIVVGAAIAFWVSKDAGFRRYPARYAPARPMTQPAPLRDE